MSLVTRGMGGQGLLASYGFGAYSQAVIEWCVEYGVPFLGWSALGSPSRWGSAEMDYRWTSNEVHLRWVYDELTERWIFKRVNYM